MDYYQGNADYLALCFSKENRKTAEQIAECLLDSRVRVWSTDNGCALTEDAEASRFEKCRAAVIVISKEWTADPMCRLQLQAAAALDLSTLLIFIDETDLSADADLSALLNRSDRMTDFNPKKKQEFLDAVMPLLCVRDCLMSEDEQPKKKKGLFGLFK
ncbi:MAG: toll/interleukin-1 receptor domain-containing protein [Oscillospiraceae bacterium]|nr:toll/interleukin-1 receptor domain-containing protein [Oscillospiraceae bacterium]